MAAGEFVEVYGGDEDGYGNLSFHHFPYRREYIWDGQRERERDVFMLIT